MHAPFHRVWLITSFILRIKAIVNARKKMCSKIVKREYREIWVLWWIVLRSPREYLSLQESDAPIKNHRLKIE